MPHFSHRVETGFGEDLRKYWQVPDPGDAVRSVARPRLLLEFDKVAVTLVLRPPAGRTMRVASGPREAFAGQAAQALSVTTAEGALCTVYLSIPTSTILGWTTSAETGIGYMRQEVVIEQTAVVDGVRVPTVLSESTGERYRSITRYTSVVVGNRSLVEFGR